MELVSAETIIDYRPQPSCCTIMFLYLSVILFTRGGGGMFVSVHWSLSGWYASCWNAFLLLPATKLQQVNVNVSRILSTGGGGISVPACTTGHMTRGSLCPGGLPGGVSVQGGLCQGETPPTETPHTVTSGRYESYWNAFLFNNIFILLGFLVLFAIRFTKCIAKDMSLQNLCVK